MCIRDSYELLRGGKLLRHLAGGWLVGEVHDAEQALVPERAGVGEQLPVLGQDEVVAAVDD